MKSSNNWEFQASVYCSRKHNSNAVAMLFAYLKNTCQSSYGTISCMRTDAQLNTMTKHLETCLVPLKSLNNCHSQKKSSWFELHSCIGVTEIAITAEKRESLRNPEKMCIKKNCSQEHIHLGIHTHMAETFVPRNGLITKPGHKQHHMLLSWSSSLGITNLKLWYLRKAIVNAVLFFS